MANRLILNVNGSPLELASGSTITHLIAHLQLQNRRIAIELNGEIVPRSQHENTLLNINDRIEIVHAIGGG